MNNNGENKVKIKNNLAKEVGGLSVASAGFLTVSGSLGLFYGGESMLKSWVETSRGNFVVKTGTVTPQGFVNIQRTDRFPDLKQANKKSELCNYIFKKAREACRELAGVNNEI